jgi:hypothetical protein
VSNINQNTTSYSVLELGEFEQQYSAQFVVIYSRCQKLFAKNHTEGPGIKIGHIQSIQNSGTLKTFGQYFDFLRIFTELENFSTGKNDLHSTIRTNIHRKTS